MCTAKKLAEEIPPLDTRYLTQYDTDLVQQKISKREEKLRFI